MKLSDIFKMIGIDVSKDYSEINTNNEVLSVSEQISTQVSEQISTPVSEQNSTPVSEQISTLNSDVDKMAERIKELEAMNKALLLRTPVEKEDDFDSTLLSICGYKEKK